MSGQTIITSRGRVEVPEPGEYVDPRNGQRYTLCGVLGYTVTRDAFGGVIGFTGWPENWEDLVPEGER
ncbi:hypothetical protein ACFVU2_21160 [Leifsonia sp. NPDC058194]|uniref:hypothetical protein n=1 Tax=Leifsonia sp. NPDC058194 TaxID=3346374 RepID=UPI0036D8B449